MKKLFTLAVLLTCTTFMMAMDMGDHQMDKAEVYRKMQTPEVQQMVDNLRTFINQQAKSEKAEALFVGSEYCIACHGHSLVKDTKHLQFLRRPIAEWTLVSGKGVMADYDGNGQDDFLDGLDFNTIDSVFDAYKPNAPILSVEDGVYYMTIGELKMEVVCTQAGFEGGGQRFLVRVPVTDYSNRQSKSPYFAPIYWSGSSWTSYSPANWWDGNTPKWDSSTTSMDLTAHTGNYSRNCVGCHATGIRDLGQTASGEWYFEGFPASLYEENDPAYFDYNGDGVYELMNIGCEMCHAGGAQHILAGGDPELMIGGDDFPMTPEGGEFALETDICGRCHSQFHSAPNGTFSWPFDDENMVNYIPNMRAPLAPFFIDDTTRWPDGKHMKTGRPYSDYIKSSKASFAHHKVTCTECHSGHSGRREHQLSGSLHTTGADGEDLRVPISPENNTICLACHATHGEFADITKEMVADYENNEAHIAEVVSEHTNHPYAPERMMGLSNCIGCHMPTTNGHGTLTGASHTFECISPEKTLMYQPEGGMPNSCAVSCHQNKVNSFDLGLDPNSNNAIWNETFDVDLATELQNYYGPGGMWWDTTPAEEGKNYSRFLR